MILYKRINLGFDNRDCPAAPAVRKLQRLAPACALTLRTCLLKMWQDLAPKGSASCLWTIPVVVADKISKTFFDKIFCFRQERLVGRHVSELDGAWRRNVLRSGSSQREPRRSAIAGMAEPPVTEDKFFLPLHWKYKKLVIFVFILYNILMTQVLAQSGNKLDLPPDIAAIKIPEESGRIMEYHAGSKPFTIFYIQDAHVNYEAQKAIAKIIELLIQKKELRLVLVEGGIGDVSLTEYRVGAKEKRKEIADQLLKEGKISGEEYLNFVEEYPLLLWGIESQVLYDENLIAFTKAEPLMQPMLNELAKIRASIQALKPALYPKDYLEFENKIEAMTAKHDLHNEAKLLLETAKAKQIEMSGYPNIQVLSSLIQLESGADFEKVDYERTQLVQKLQRIVPAKRLREVLDFESTVKNDSLKRAAFYEKVLALAGEFKVDAAPFSSLKAAVPYLREQDKIDSIAFFSEKEKLVDRIAEKYLKSGAGAGLPSPSQGVETAPLRLYQMSKDLQILESLVKLELVPEHYQIYMDQHERFQLVGWASFLKEEAKIAGKSIELPKNMKNLDETIDSFQEFYRVANIRDQALVENLTEKIKEEREPESILIAGGFHKDRLIRKMLRIGFNVVVISPTVGLNQGPELYRKMLVEKWEQGRWYIKGESDQTEARAS